MPGFKIQLSAEQEQEIISYYLEPNSLRDAAARFSLSISVIRRVLKVNKIAFHSGSTLNIVKTRNTIKTCLDRYGETNAKKVAAFKEKGKQTCLERYGRTNVGQFGSPEHKASLLKNYGRLDVGQFGTLEHEKALLEKYGRTNVGQFGTLEHTEAIKAKYGVDKYTQTDEFKSKFKATMLNKYGVCYTGQSPELRKKMSATMHKRYGMFHSPKNTYIADNIYFDSFPELCFYLYHKSIGKDIKREPVGFAYSYDNTESIYYPDFSVDDVLYEIKGKQFRSDNGTWKNPFTKTTSTRDIAKYNCAVAHNVIILYSEDYQQYINWFKEHEYKREDYIVKNKQNNDKIV